MNSIAVQYGFSWQTLWDHPENRDLKDRRGDPMVLLPGDEVFYPEKEEKLEDRGVEQKHAFQLPGIPFKLKIVLRKPDHSPADKIPWRLELDGQAGPTGTTGTSGLVEASLPAATQSAVLYLSERPIPLKLRHLDPANTGTGIQQRLANLGMDVGPIDNIIGPRTRRILAQFQSLHGLDPTGQPDDQTIQLLRDLHEGKKLNGKVNEIEEHEIPPPVGLKGDDGGGGDEDAEEEGEDSEEDEVLS